MIYQKCTWRLNFRPVIFSELILRIIDRPILCLKSHFKTCLRLSYITTSICLKVHYRETRWQYCFLMHVNILFSFWISVILFILYKCLRYIRIYVYYSVPVVLYNNRLIQQLIYLQYIIYKYKYFFYELFEVHVIFCRFSANIYFSLNIFFF